MDFFDWLQNLDGMNRTVYGVAAWQWISLVVIVLPALFSAGIGVLISALLLKIRDKALSHRYSRSVRRTIRFGVGTVFFAWAYGAFADRLDLIGLPETIVEDLVKAIAITGGTLVILAFWDALFQRLADAVNNRSDRAEKLLIPVIHKFVRMIVIVVCFLVILAIVAKINIPALIASLGIGGVVIALAAKDSVENVFGSLTILFDMPFALGDWVKVDKFEGAIEEINLRSTRIRTAEDTLITLPNANLIRAGVENLGARRARRQRYLVPVVHGSKIESIQKMVARIREKLDAIPVIESARTQVAIDSTDANGINILTLTFADAANYTEELSIRQQVVSAIISSAQEFEITLGTQSPTTVVTMNSGQPANEKTQPKPPNK